MRRGREDNFCGDPIMAVIIAGALALDRQNKEFRNSTIPGI
jgi:hypothetical protein